MSGPIQAALEAFPCVGAAHYVPGDARAVELRPPKVRQLCRVGHGTLRKRVPKRRASGRDSSTEFVVGQFIALLRTYG
jgi:hypothetical protein